MVGAAAMLLVLWCFLLAHKWNLRRLEDDMNENYEKSSLEKSILREIQMSGIKQWSGKHPPPTYPEDL